MAGVTREPVKLDIQSQCRVLHSLTVNINSRQMEFLVVTTKLQTLPLLVLSGMPLLKSPPGQSQQYPILEEGLFLLHVFLPNFHLGSLPSGHHLNEFLSCRKAEAPGGIDSFELMKAIARK